MELGDGFVRHRHGARRDDAMRYLFIAAVTVLCLTSCSRGVSHFDNARQTRVHVSVLLHAMERYTADCGMRPPADDAFLALIEPRGVPGWSGPYILPQGIQQARLDLWGRALRVEMLPDGRIRISSAAGDGEFNTEDDIVQARECRAKGPG
ncbi:MAG: type II secretion system protein GspG [Lentisphaerae bacterium]|nr:type II secretion system protein GspG [Lentisphaerota bacterium]